MIKVIKNSIGSVPFFGPALRRVYGRLMRRPPVVFERSDQYWEDRYRLGGTSGSGSYGRLADFKAEFLNNFVKENEISSVVEFGCGDGAQLLRAIYPRYAGFDVSTTSVQMCRERFSGNSNYEFHLVGSDRYNAFDQATVALSLDVIYHLIEDKTFDNYMKKLFRAAERFVVIYAYDFDRAQAPHERGRKFTFWIQEHAPLWKLAQKIPNKFSYDPKDPDNTSHCDFFIYTRCG